MHFTLLPWARLFQVCYKNDTLLYIREKAGSKEMNQPLLFKAPFKLILTTKCDGVEFYLFYHGKEAVGTCW